MEIPELLALLGRLDVEADEAIDLFNAELARALEVTAVEMMGPLSKIKFGAAGGPAATLTDQRVARRKALELQTLLKALLLKGGYAKAVEGLLARTEAVVQGLGGYFGKVAVNFNPDRHLYKQVVADGRGRLIEALMGAGLEADLVSPVVTKIYRQVAAGATLADTVTVMRQTLAEEGAPAQLARKLASDGLAFVRADYIRTVSADVGLEHYLYAGTVISQSRPFCVSRTGKPYTQAEVEAWGKLKEWEGQIPGTDEKTIWIYRGGYRCRHQLYPISREMYEYLKGPGGGPQN